MLRAPRALGALASAFDHMATAAVRLSRPPSPPLSAERLDLYESLATFYETHEGELFPPPGRIEPWLVQRGSAIDLSWPSRHQVLEPSVATELLHQEASALCQVRLRRRLDRAGRQRPVIVFIHGYLAGSYAFEERIWPLDRLERAGFDTALFTLPFHGLRAVTGARQSPPFPGRDPALNIEGFRQSVCDLRDLLAWLRSEGHPSSGLVGMSLGGYAAALTATIEPSLDFLVPVIPLACLADFASEQGHLPNPPKAARHYDAVLRKVYRAVSPCERTPLIEGRRVLVIGARADRITRVSHARRLAHHFGAELHTWPGGHLLQWGRSEAFVRMERHLREVIGPTDL